MTMEFQPDSHDEQAQLIPGSGLTGGMPAPGATLDLSDEQFLQLARAVVPEHLHALGHVNRQSQGPVEADLASANPVDSLPELADFSNVAAQFHSTGSASADVEFVENTPIGKRSTVVLVRNGRVKRVLKLA